MMSYVTPLWQDAPFFTNYLPIYFQNAASGKKFPHGQQYPSGSNVMYQRESPSMLHFIAHHFLLHMNIFSRYTQFIPFPSIALCIPATHPPNQFQKQKLQLYQKRLLLQIPNWEGKTWSIFMQINLSLKARCSATLIYLVKP